VLEKRVDVLEQSCLCPTWKRRLVEVPQSTIVILRSCSPEPRGGGESSHRVERAKRSIKRKKKPIWQRSVNSEGFFAGLHFQPAIAEKPMVLHAETLLRWNNSRERVRDGAVLIWTDSGRPQAAVTGLSAEGTGLWRHEFQSLSTEPFEATTLAVRYGRPPERGSKGKDAPDARRRPRPTVRGFENVRRRPRISGESTTSRISRGRWELRSSPSPSIAMPRPKMGIVDGALFTFPTPHGNDQEVFV